MTPELDLLVKAAVQVPPKRHHTYIETYTHINKNRCMLICVFTSVLGVKKPLENHIPAPLILLSSGASAGSLFLGLIMGSAERKNQHLEGVTGEESVMLDR